MSHAPRSLTATHGPLKSPVKNCGKPGDQVVPETVGDQVGPYQLCQRMGDDCHGTVWMARQQTPLPRMVSLWIGKPALNAGQVPARSETERQALTTMDHPNIAKIFDAGTTESGRPYLAREPANGVPLTRFCRERRYGLRSRVALLRKVCAALHHAHQKGIIHGNLNPASVLVTLQGNQAVPMLVGFGCTAATSGKVIGRSLFTRRDSDLPFDHPAYLSPEQTGRHRSKIDARSDLYSLGVLLYELLAGRPPFDPITLYSASPAGMRRIIRHKEPPAPSTRLPRRSSPSESSNPIIPLRSVQGRLDWIVMKAIEKNRDGRYQSAHAFAADLRVYLCGERVQATPPSRFRKFVRRHRALCGLAITLALAWATVDATNRWDSTLDTRFLLDSGPARPAARMAPAESRRAQKPAPPPLPLAEQSYEGPLDREAPRGVRTVTFKVPDGRPDEICVIPRHLPFAKYRGKGGAKDRADERKLASYDYYKSGTAESGVIGISPKRNSTSAAVNVYALPPGTSRPAQLTASYCRSVEKAGKRVAKFKQTDNKFTTTSTASILGYYHVSRALGDICEIKPAVLRTMDVQQHKKVVRLASEMGARGTVAKSWALFNRYYANPRRSGVARDLFTSDYLQIYGALLENTNGEGNYSEWLKVGANLSSTRAFRQMADSRPAAAILGSRTFSQRNVQALVAMRDMSELILLDYLLAQSDRLSGGNISAYSFAYDFVGGAVDSRKASKAGDLPPGATRVIVKKLTIKDTDAGLLNSNVFERRGYLERIRHMHPNTYACLQTFARKWEQDPAVRAFFLCECTFNSKQLARFEKYLLTAATTLRKHRENGTLLLDLDLDDYFQESSPPPVDWQLAASVGRWERGAVNRPEDVKTVQRLLTTAARSLQVRALDPMGVDGHIAYSPRRSNTVAAIEALEHLGKLPGHGVVEPDSEAWRTLLQAAGETSERRRGENPPARLLSLAEKDAGHAR